MKKQFYILIICCIYFTSCENKTTTINQEQQPELIIEATSFSGEKLYQRKADATSLAKYQKIIEALDSKSEKTEKDFIELGNAYATIFQYQNAIKTFNAGLTQFPESYKLLRYKAHRLLNTRKVEEAMVDLDKAIALINESNKDELEYYEDGKVKGTYEFWIYYHIGLGHYLNKDYPAAVDAFKNCVNTVVTAKNKVGATDWLYNSLQLAGDSTAANDLIESFIFDEGTDMKYPYASRILFYKREVKPEELVDFNKPSKDWTGSDITNAYGIGNWYKFNGEMEKGIDIHKKILDSKYWNAWAYVVADRELAEGD